MLYVRLQGSASTLTTIGGRALCSKNSEKCPKTSKNEGNSVNQGDPDDIMRQSNKSKNKNTMWRISN
jgi:hypothetical protein